jgi:hypothetical protein
MIPLLLAAILFVLLCVALTDDGFRYLLAQLAKMVLGFGLAALCLAFMAILLINMHH